MDTSLRGAAERTIHPAARIPRTYATNRELTEGIKTGGIKRGEDRLITLPTAEHNNDYKGIIIMFDATSLIGKRFGKLVVIAIGEPYITTTGHPVKRMLCRCDCGKERNVKCVTLKNGRSRSCGCAPRVVKHGHARRGQKFAREYRIWRAMKRRCLDPKIHNYERYGGRGIKVDERWMDFENFLSDMGKCPSEEHCIERKDNDGNYEPANCIWATNAQQQQNTSNNSVYTIRGVTACLAELCRKFGVDYNRTVMRLHKGWNVEDAFFRGRNAHKIDAETAHKIRSLKGQKTQAELAEMFGVTRSQISMIHANKRWVTQ